jgi:molybdopterin-biosynthesis enzyme MoeA-like protein
MLENPLGGAPGFLLGNVWVLPGLPREMEAMFELYEDELRAARPIRVWRRRERTRESTIAPALEHATASWPAVSVGSYPSFHPDGPRVEVVLKSSDVRQFEAAVTYLDHELDLLT